MADSTDVFPGSGANTREGIVSMLPFQLTIRRVRLCPSEAPKGLAVCVDFTVLNRDTGEPLDLTYTDHVSEFVAASVPTAELVQRALAKVVKHEVDECLLLDRRPYEEPHPEVEIAEQNRRAIDAERARMVAGMREARFAGMTPAEWEQLGAKSLAKPYTASGPISMHPSSYQKVKAQLVSPSTSPAALSPTPERKTPG